jgi:hypothetical protein
MSKTAYRILALIFAFAAVPAAVAGPYAPEAEQPGSTAVSMNSAEFVAWATGYTNYLVGAEVVSTWRMPEKALGPAVGDSFDIVCLGRGGQITLTFDRPISNVQGWDFAVFENSFSDTYLELAYVEVSSDGITFVRFDNDSLTVSPVGGFGAVDPTNIDGFAGKYRQGFGTPFDLTDLASKQEVLSGDVNLSAITHIRLVDVVGDGSYFDTSGDVIYDAYPTFQSAGFDLDAVGVRYVQAENLPPDKPELVFPTDAATSVALNVTLHAGTFSDPDTDKGDFHLRTHWQLSTDATFADTLLDLVSSVALTELRLSEAVLAAATNYYWQVQYIDGREEESPWSDRFSFETAAASSDGDSNGIPDAQDLPVGSPVDLNADQVPDVTQIDQRFKVLKTAVGGGQMAVSTETPGAVIDFVEAVSPDDYPEGSGKPEDTLLGLLNLRLSVQSSGDDAAITVYLSEPAPAGYQWFKYDAIRGWRTVADAVFSSDRRAVTLTLADGGSTDGDGRADGVILDPGGAGLAANAGPSQIPPDGKAGVGGDGCFIDTAAGSVGFDRAWLVAAFWTACLAAALTRKAFK